MCQVCKKLKYQAECRRLGIEPDPAIVKAKIRGRRCKVIEKVIEQNYLRKNMNK